MRCNMIYLDNCATTKPRAEVVDEMNLALTEYFANPSSLHSAGMKVEDKIENSRKIIADFIGAKQKEIYFTSGGTESNNIFINGAIKKNKRIGKRIITTLQEHPAVGEVFANYEKEGYEVIYLGSDSYGRVNLNELEAAVDEKTALVSIMHVNNELGTINNILEASKIIKSKNPKTLFYVDGVQALGKLKINLRELEVDGYSISGHKVHGPKGIGALYVKENLNIEPSIFGGGQEKGLRSGTENTPGIFGFAKAIEVASENFEEEYNKKHKLRNLLIRELECISDYIINTPLLDSVDSILNVSFLKTRGEVLLHYLEGEDIFISTTSACSSNHKVKSNLEKLNKPLDVCEGSIRICTSYEITEEDIKVFVQKLKHAVEDIRKITMR